MIISFKLKDEWIELLNAYNFEITLWTFVAIAIKVCCAWDTDNLFGWMKDRIIAGKLVSSMVLLKAIIKIDLQQLTNI